MSVARTAYPARKIAAVERLKNLISSHGTILVADFSGFPSNYFKTIRKALRGKAQVLVAKNKLFRVALQEVKPNLLNSIDRYLHGQNVFLFSNLHPLRLSWILKENPFPSSLKPGEVAPKDIVIPEGPTELSPGPIIDELARMGINTKVQGGKIYISRDKVVLKAGEVVTEEIARILNLLGIKPINTTFGLKVAVDSDGVVYPPEVLDLTVEDITEAIRQALEKAVKVAVATCLPSRDAAPFIVQKVHLKAISVAAALNLLTPQTTPYVLLKAASHARALQGVIKKAG